MMPWWTVTAIAAVVVLLANIDVAIALIYFAVRPLSRAPTEEKTDAADEDMSKTEKTHKMEAFTSGRRLIAEEEEKEGK